MFDSKSPSSTFSWPIRLKQSFPGTKNTNQVLSTTLKYQRFLHTNLKTHINTRTYSLRSTYSKTTRMKRKVNSFSIIGDFKPFATRMFSEGVTLLYEPASRSSNFYTTYLEIFQLLSIKIYLKIFI